MTIEINLICVRTKKRFNIDSLLLDQKQTRKEKEKGIEEKKFALVAKFFCGHAYSTDLIGMDIFGARLHREEKSH